MLHAALFADELQRYAEERAANCEAQLRPLYTLFMVVLAESRVAISAPQTPVQSREIINERRRRRVQQWPCSLRDALSKMRWPGNMKAWALA